MQYHVWHHSVSLLFVIQGMSGSVAHGSLFLKLHALFQSHVLQKLFQAQFSEVTLCLILSRQRLCQFVGSVTYLLALFYGVFYRGIQPHHRLLALLSAFLNSILHVYDVFLQWVEDRRQRLPVLFRQLFGAFFQYLLRCRIHLLLYEVHLLLHLFLLLLAQTLQLLTMLLLHALYLFPVMLAQAFQLFALLLLQRLYLRSMKSLLLLALPLGIQHTFLQHILLSLHHQICYDAADAASYQKSYYDICHHLNMSCVL